MIRLTQTAKCSINKLASILQERINEKAIHINKIQEDNETGSSLCEILFTNKKALVWVRLNGSISSEKGEKILLTKGRLPKRNPPLNAIMLDIKPNCHCYAEAQKGDVIANVHNIMLVWDVVAFKLREEFSLGESTLDLVSSSLPVTT